MRLALAAALATTTLLLATAQAGAETPRATVDMCAVTPADYQGEIYDNGWLAGLAAKLKAGEAICERQSMHALGTIEGRTYVYWDAVFSEQDPSYEPPRRPHVVAQIGEYDTDGTLKIIHRTVEERDESELIVNVLERDGDVLIAMTDPESDVLVRGPGGFKSVDGLGIGFSLDAGVVDPKLPEGYVGPRRLDDGEGGVYYKSQFDPLDFAIDLPVAVASEIFPRAYADPEYDRPLTLRFPLHRDGDDLVTGEPELIEGTPTPGGIGETPTSFAAPEKLESCDIYAYVEDDDPAGVTVRATPDAKGVAIATLPAAHSSSDGEVVFGAELRVIASVDGWFLIENAQHPAQIYGDDSTPPSGAGSNLVRTTYSGRGWVHGSRLSTEIEVGDQLRASPDPKSRPVFDLKIDSDNYAEVTGFKSCEGEALELSVKRSIDGVEGSGWIGGDGHSEFCSNQATTCV